MVWSPVCQVGKWQGMFGEVEITEEHMDRWINAFGRNEKIPVTKGHIADPDNPHTSTGEPALCWINGLMRKGDVLLGNYVNFTPGGLEAVMGNEYMNPSIESKDGQRLNSVALLGARTPAVDFHDNSGGRFTPFDMSGCLGEECQIVLAQNLNEMALVYKTPPSRITKFFEDEKGPQAWMKAFNSAYKDYDGDEEKANATAWSTIEELGYTKGDDGKYRKSKSAASAATEGGRIMAENDAANAAEEKTALARLLAKLGIGEESKPEPIAAAKGEPSAEMVAMAARMDALEKENADIKGDLAMAGAMATARELCEAAHLPPKFEKPMAEYMAGKAEITLAEPERDKEGNVTKEYKLSRNDFFSAVLVSKGTAKLDDPKKLENPPIKREVSPFVASSSKYMPEDPAEQAALAEQAQHLVRTEGKTIQEATAFVLAEWQKKQEA